MKLFIKPLCAAILIASLSPWAAQAVVAPIAADSDLTPTAVGASAGAAVAVTIQPSNKGLGLLKFDLSALPNGIASRDIAKATLVFFVKSVDTSGPLQASPVLEAWDENTVSNRRTALAIGAPAATTAAISRSNSYFAMDVTNLVLDWVDFPASNNGLALAPVGSALTAITLDSKESTQTSHPAYIEISLNGPAGRKGDTGPQGLKGDAGPQGLKGAMGPQGIQGLKGDVGARGIQGERGLPGEMGLSGKQGLQGVPGVQGPIGLTGQQGPKGDVGATGPQGEQGLVGPQSLSSSIYRDQRSYVLPAYSYKTLETMCGPEYPNLLGGGCGHRDDNDVQTDIVVNYAGPSPTNPRVWRCMVDNGNQFRSRTVLIYTICAK